VAWVTGGEAIGEADAAGALEAGLGALDNCGRG